MLNNCAKELYDLYDMLHTCYFHSGVDMFTEIVKYLAPINDVKMYCDQVHNYWISYCGGGYGRYNN